VVRANLKGVFPTYKILRDGTRRRYWYHRAAKKRLRGDPGSAEFMVDYVAAEASIQTPTDDGATFNGLARQYTLSAEFQGTLAPSTQSEYRRLLKTAEQEFRDLPTAALKEWEVREDFLNWREKVARTSGYREADHRLSAISAMLTWAVDRGRLPVNHLKGFKRLYGTDRSDMIWEAKHIDAFLSVASPEMQLALVLALHTGQRQGDIRRMAWSAYDGECITLRQGKAKRRGLSPKPVIVPCTQALKKTLDKAPRRAAVILATKTGRAFTKRYLAAQWEAACKAAGISGLHFHDIRGTTVTMLAEAGCTVPEIASITGHSLRTAQQILDKYLAKTSKLAANAIAKFENVVETGSANRAANRARASERK
jgi:integrase